MTIEVGEYRMVPIDSIEMSDRARKELGNLSDLRANMEEIGLIGALAVKEIEDNKYKLLAGGRRFTVLKNAGIVTVPIRVYKNELTDLEMLIVEKSENFYRKDMEHWEMDELTLQIQEGRESIHGKKTPGPTSSGWGLADTAKELGVGNKQTISKSIQRAKLRREHPEVFQGCKTAADADKLIKKVGKALETKLVAEKIANNTANTTVQDITKRYIVNDFFKGIKDIPNGVMDLVEIDPPYAIELQKKKKKDGVSQYVEGDYNEVEIEQYAKFIQDVFSESYRVMKPNSWLICWFAPEPWFEVIWSLLMDAGFKTTRMCGVWNKGYGQSNAPNLYLANSYEMFFYAWKGRPELNKPGTSNIFNTPPVPSQQKTHPTERPVELMQTIYNTFSPVGSKLLIPFLGSGNGLFAAHRLGMDAVGFEKTKSYKDSFIVKANNGIGYLK